MNANDKRIPLNIGNSLTIQKRNYYIRDVVGYGGNCLAYCSEREASENEREIGIPNVPAIIKEFYPLELVAGIKRNYNGELVTQSEQGLFNTLKDRFESGTAKQTAFSISDGNHSLPLPVYAALNGTAYTAVTLTNGQTLDVCVESLSMLEKADVITSLCNAIGKLHTVGNLYLDVKPPNIFVFEKDANESRRVALFDFDTVTAVDAVNDAVISFSEGWSPYEQTNLRREEITFSTDIYAIGAVCYWLYSGKKISDFILDEVIRGRFGFLDEVEGLHSNKRLKETISQILSATLKRLPDKRAQRVEDILS